MQYGGNSLNPQISSKELAPQHPPLLVRSPILMIAAANRESVSDDHLEHLHGLHRPISFTLVSNHDVKTTP